MHDRLVIDFPLLNMQSININRIKSIYIKAFKNSHIFKNGNNCIGYDQKHKMDKIIANIVTIINNHNNPIKIKIKIFNTCENMLFSYFMKFIDELIVDYDIHLHITSKFDLYFIENTINNNNIKKLTIDISLTSVIDFSEYLIFPYVTVLKIVCDDMCCKIVS